MFMWCLLVYIFYNKFRIQLSEVKDKPNKLDVQNGGQVTRICSRLDLLFVRQKFAFEN